MPRGEGCNGCKGCKGMHWRSVAPAPDGGTTGDSGGGHRKTN